MIIIKLLSGYKKEAETDLDSVEFAHINLISSQILWIFPRPPNAVKESFLDFLYLQQQPAIYLLLKPVSLNW